MKTNLTHRSFRRLILSVFLAGFTSGSPIRLEGAAPPAPEQPTLPAASGEGQGAIATFRYPSTLQCSLFAAEPLLGNPVVFGVDRLGNVFVCESYRQNKGVTDNRGHDEQWLARDLAAMTVEDRIRFHRELLGEKASEYEKYDDLIRVLSDKNSDGIADESVVFASGFNGLEEGTGAGVLIRDEQVLYTNIPNLWSLKDTDGDLKSDARTSLSTGYGVRVAFRGHDMHGLVMGPDGRVYFSIGDRGYSVQTPDGKLQDPESGAVFRCELDGSHLEVFATGLRNPQELAFDNHGNLFTGDNNSDSGDRARWVQVVEGGDTGWRMMYQYLSDRGPFNREKIWYPYGPETPAYIVPPIANLSDGPSGLVYYPGVGLDGNEDLAGSFFLCDFRGQSSNSGIRRIKLKPKGATFEIQTNEEYIWNVLATDVDFAPDGSMYLSDWVNGWDGENKGRIYRFAPKSEDSAAAGKRSAEILKNGFKTLAASQLASLLSNPDRRIRFESQYELAARGETTVLAEALRSESALVRLHAVWGLGQIARRTDSNTAKELLLSALSDNDESVVARACEALSESKNGISSIQLKTLLANQSPVVRVQAMMAVGRTSASDCLEDVAKILVDNDDKDPIVRHAGIMAFAGAIGDSPENWVKHNNESVRVAVAVALRKSVNPSITLMLDDAAPRVVREVVRAIYDVPGLYGQLPKLANLTVAEEFDPAIVQRIIHANFRLGGEANAQRLISFATSKLSTAALRAEAIQLLGDWGKPGPRDRILNRHLPLDDRPSEFVAKLIQENIATLASTDDEVRDEFFKVGAKLEIRGIAKLLEAIVEDSEANSSRRADSIRALARLRPDLIIERGEKLFADRNAAVRVAALQSFATLSSEKTPIQIKLALQSTDATERQAAWDLLQSENKLDTSFVTALIDSEAGNIVSGKLPLDTQLNAIEAALAKGSTTTKDTINAYIESRDQQIESSPRTAYADCLEGGDIQAGRELFFTRSSLSCVRCHKVGETGGEVGPNLSQIGTQKDTGYLLESIIAPDTAIANGFETVVVLTEDDESFSGILKTEDDDRIQIMDAQGALITIEKDSIVARKKGLSSMPAGLMKYMNRRELRDLVAYLKSLDGTPVSTAKVGDVGGHK
ncbi:MAG: HEAT repeat domain-containing protein [Pirellula sp.]|jgi:quinoprotein glucose dehydrogenase